MAQSVERRIGSAEVTGSIPVSSFKKMKCLTDASFFVLLKKCKKMVQYTIFRGILS